MLSSQKQRFSHGYTEQIHGKNITHLEKFCLSLVYNVFITAHHICPCKSHFLFYSWGAATWSFSDCCHTFPMAFSPLISPQVPHSHCLSSVLPCWKLLSDVHLPLILLAAFDILSNPTTCQLGHQPMSRPAALSQAPRFSPSLYSKSLGGLDPARKTRIK